jgi:hypothetical protein
LYNDIYPDDDVEDDGDWGWCNVNNSKLFLNDK